MMYHEFVHDGELIEAICPDFLIIIINYISKFDIWKHYTKTNSCLIINLYFLYIRQFYVSRLTFIKQNSFFVMLNYQKKNYVYLVINSRGFITSPIYFVG